MQNPNGNVLDNLGIRPDHNVVLVGNYPALAQILVRSCKLTQVLGQPQLEQLARENKAFDRVILTYSPGDEAKDIEDLLVIRAAQLVVVGGLLYLFCPVRSVAEAFGKTVLKYYPTHNVKGANTIMGAVMVTSARGNPEAQK
ncbi:MAG: hypothetical protein ACYDHY_06745 [Acidiferrobacterales bacterium]